MKHRPYLINLIENRKIREYGDNEKQVTSGQTINYILALLGISSQAKDGKSIHYLAVEDLMLTEYGKFTFEEIREAFKMLVKGVFSEDIKEVYNKLDGIIFGKVMKAYEKERERITSNYYLQLQKKVYELQWKNEISEEEKRELVLNGLKECYLYFLNNNKIEVGRVYVFETLLEKGLLEEFRDKWKSYIEKAKSIKIAEIEKDVTAPNYKGLIKQIENGEVPGYVTKARELVLIDYFRKLRLNNVSPEKLLEIYEK